MIENPSQSYNLDPQTRIGIAMILVVVMIGILVEFTGNAPRPSAALADDPDSPAIGNPYGHPVTVIVFSDYHCGPCKGLSTELEALTQEDTHLRVIFKEYPVLSDNSVLAARSALAVHYANDRKYFPYHQALMQSEGAFTPETLASLAGTAGIEYDAYAKALQDPRIDAQIARNRDTASQLGLRGVPTVVVGDKVMTGDNIERIKMAITETRKSSENSGTENPSH